MAKVVGEIAVEVGADISPLQRAMRQGARSMDTFGARAARMGANFAKVGGVIAAGTAAAAAGSYALAKSAADSGAEIERLSRLAGTTPETFQKMADAARSAGIEQDKLADILKDVQDRVGDFLATGGGPMADFFENIAPKVGVTASHFKNLSGPDALQLFVRSLEEANISQSEMTFYLEAMASDLSLLYPLLKDNGTEMKRLGEEAEQAGRIMSDDAVRGAIELQRELDGLTRTIGIQLNEAILENKDEIIRLADDIETVWIPALINVAEAITTVITAIGDAIEEYKKLRDLVQKGIAPGFTGGEQIPGFDGNIPSANDPITGGGGGSLDDGGAYDLYGIGGDNTEGGMAGDMLQFSADQNAAIELQQIEHFERLGDIMSGYHSDRFGALTEALENEIALQQEYSEKAVELDRVRAQARLQAISGAFGDIAALMLTENKKLFKIGQAGAIAEATVNGYSAAVAAWEKGMKIGGPGMAAAFTAASLARTGALISQIASQSPMGGGGSGGGGGGGASAQQATPTQTVAINLQGDTFSRASVEGLLEQIQSELDRGGRLVFE